MEDITKKKQNPVRIGGLVALIFLLVLGVKMIFVGLEHVLPQPVPEQNTEELLETDAPRFCVRCGKELPETFQWGQFCPYCGEKMDRD